MLASLWEQTDNVVMEGGIGSLVTLLHEFSKDARHVVTALVPSLENVREVGIKSTALLARFALWERPSSQPALHRPGTYAYPACNGGLTHAALVQSDHLLIVRQTFLASVLLKTQERRRDAGGSFGLPNRCRGIEGSLCLTFPLSCQMMREQPLQSLSEIFEEMEPIRTLSGLGSALRSSRGIGASTIPADRLEIWVLAHPGG